MKISATTFITEWMKLRRSKLFWATFIFFIFIPLMMGLLMYVSQHPEIGSKLGLIGTKATMFGENDWEGFLSVLNQLIASVGLIGFGFVTSWIFGREYLEHTLTDIIALPVSRSSIVIAKFIIIFIWCALLTLILFLTGLAIGHIIAIPGWSQQVLLKNAGIYFYTAFLTLLLTTTVAFIATIGKGIIAPIGFVIIVLIIAQFVALVGLGPYFPWAIPGINTIPPGTQGLEIVPASYIILILTSILGFTGTIAWWRYADQR